MNWHDKIAKDPRITRPLAELLKKIQEIVDPYREPTKRLPSSNSQDSPSFEPQEKQ